MRSKLTLRSPRIAAAIAALGATWLTAHASRAGGPPAGWEVAPPRDAKALRPIERCGDSADCLHRQTVLETAPDTTPWQAFEIDFASLPAVRSLVSPADDAALRDVPAVRAIDGEGRAFPWIGGARRAVAIMPPGDFGEIAWNKSYPSPFFADARYRSMGDGTRHEVGERESVKDVLSGAVTYLSLDLVGKDVVLDRVAGQIDGSPSIVAKMWEHVATAQVPGGFGHAYREDGAEPKVVFLFPEVLLDAETTRVSLGGGFTPGNRFATHAAFTRYVMPAGADGSATASFHVLDSQRRRWFAALQPKEKLPPAATYVISVSRSSVEKTPRIVVFTRPRKSPD